MVIQKCKNCRTRFRYTAFLKPMMGFTNPLLCNNCGSPHQVTFISRLTLSALIMLPAFFSKEIRSFVSSIQLTLLLYLIYLVIIKALSPYILRYELKDSIKN